MQDAYGRTALDLASQNGHTKLVSVLKSFGAQEEMQLIGLQKWRLDVLSK